VCHFLPSRIPASVSLPFTNVVPDKLKTSVDLMIVPRASVSRDRERRPQNWGCSLA
jgi:hypothetical protein